MDRERGDVMAGETFPERRQLPWWPWAPVPRGGVVAEDLERGRADLGRAVGGLDHAVPQRQVRPKPTSVRKHRTKGSGARRVGGVTRGGPSVQAQRARPGPAPRAVLGLDLHCRPWTPTCSWAFAPSWTSIACGSWAGWRRVPADPETLARELKLPVHLVRKQLEVLAQAGLVEARPDRPDTLGVRMDRVGQLGRELAIMEREAQGLPGLPGGAWPHDGEPLADTLARLRPTPEEARTLRAFLVDGRLVSIPAQPAKRQIVLRFLLERVFTEDREYPEKEVNARLASFHPDVASLRRYLYDEHYVDRQVGLYRRSGPRPGAPGAPGAGSAGSGPGP